eukprot:TRINITY_DN62_c0_g1_i3.p1 TRINITY_DN62_c0_g1~~TRINITY_DN62_c0_g1_i3.p1  ORF type:complete len:688 (+),score=218.59 TRINITY_DN62_c0_g1_i3:772-2835(+)
MKETLEDGQVKNRVNGMIMHAAERQQAMMKQHVEAMQQQQQQQQMMGQGEALEQNQQQFLARIQSAMTQVKGYENKQVQAKALEIIPVQELNDRALAVDGVNFNDELMRQLLRWYKEEFFTWVNAPPCDNCGSDTEMQGMTAPFQNELTFGASRVELYRCNSCQQQTRFPRYNDPVKLLDTRRGRCGEWANCFTLLCRAMGFEARLVNDWTDHVWTEVWCEEKQTFVHTDCCENAYDAPMTYEAGWGKKLNYIIATSIDEILDVTKRYTQQYDEVLSRRNLVTEEWLANTLERIEATVHANLSSQRLDVLTRRRIREIKELNDEPREELNESEKLGRISGSASWKRQRGEDGKDIISSSSSALSSSSSSSSSSKFTLISTPITQFRVFDAANNLDKMMSALISSNETQDAQHQLDPQTLDDLCDIVHIIKLRSQNIRGTHPLESKHFAAWEMAFTVWNGQNKPLLPLLDVSRLAVRHPNAITFFSQSQSQSSSSSSFDVIDQACAATAHDNVTGGVLLTKFRLFANLFGQQLMQSMVIDHTQTFVDQINDALNRNPKFNVLLPISALIRNLAIVTNNLELLIDPIIKTVQEADKQVNHGEGGVLKGVGDVAKDLSMGILAMVFSFFFLSFSFFLLSSFSRCLHLALSQADKQPKLLDQLTDTLATLLSLTSDLPEDIITDLNVLKLT